LNPASDCNPRRSPSKFGSGKRVKPQALQARLQRIRGDNREVSPLADLILMALSAAYIPAEIDEGVAAALLSPFLLC